MNCPKCDATDLMRPADGKAVIYNCGSVEFLFDDGKTAFASSKSCKINQMKKMLKNLYEFGRWDSGDEAWHELKDWFEKE